LLAYHLDGLGTDHRPQLQGQILCGDFACVHVYAYHPHVPAFYQCLLPDDAYIETLRTAPQAFNLQLEADTMRARELAVFQHAEVLRTLGRFASAWVTRRGGACVRFT
jgi:hypothetical protein